jgi:thiamine biosynthesis lipoprotein
MDTIVTIQVSRPGPGAEASVERAFGWFQEVERRCSRFDPESELRSLCDRPGREFAASELLYRVLQFALRVAEASGGALDPTVGGVLEIHGFNRNYRTGRTSGVAVAASPVGYRCVRLNDARRTVLLEKRLLLDLGAVAKGFALDLAGAELNPLGDFAINAGGDVLVQGRNPQGEGWKVGVKDPLRPDELLAVLSLTGGAVCSSGGYERPSPDGRGHHIVNPRGSWVATAGATVVAAGAMAADALSTAAFVMGGRRGIDFVQRQGAEALLVGEDGRRFETAGFAGFWA